MVLLSLIMGTIDLKFANLAGMTWLSYPNHDMFNSGCIYLMTFWDVLLSQVGSILRIQVCETSNNFWKRFQDQCHDGS